MKEKTEKKRRGPHRTCTFYYGARDTAAPASHREHHAAVPEGRGDVVGEASLHSCCTSRTAPAVGRPTNWPVRAYAR